MTEENHVDVIDRLNLLSMELRGVSQMLEMAHESSENRGIPSEYLYVIQEIILRQSEEIAEIKDMI